MLTPNPAAAPAAYAATMRAHASRRPQSAPAGGRRPQSATEQAALLEARAAALEAQRREQEEARRQEQEREWEQEEQEEYEPVVMEEEFQHQARFADEPDLQHEDLEQQLEQLQKQKELEDQLLRLRQQEEQLLREQQEVRQRLRTFQRPQQQQQRPSLRRPPQKPRHGKQPRQQATDLRVDGKSFGGSGVHRSASAGGIQRPTSASSASGQSNQKVPESPQKAATSSMQRPVSAGSQRPSSAGSQRPVSASHPRSPSGSGLQRPASAGSFRPANATSPGYPGGHLQRPTSAASQGCPGGHLQRPASAGASPGGHQSLRDVHYESMRRIAEQRNEKLRERELNREPWTAPPDEGSRQQPRRPWSAISGYTGYRPLKDVEECMVGCNLQRSGFEARRILAAA